MAIKTIVPITPGGRAKVFPVGTISPEQRENMIREAAYFRYVRDPVPGHDLDDWLAAEAELFGVKAGPQAAEPFEAAYYGVQESAVHGFWKDDALKRIIRRHPQKGIPLVESIEPQEAPPRE